MKLKEKWKELSRKEKDWVAHKIGMALINKKFKAQEQVESMAKTVEEITGQKPTREIMNLVGDFLSS